MRTLTTYKTVPVVHRLRAARIRPYVLALTGNRR
ncbi:hypothetical protein BKA25_000609 [Actinoalloteichus hymeniacidonis]|nr:hypothetical protein [Actinoalloteichus hymeniacidonis]